MYYPGWQKGLRRVGKEDRSDGPTRTFFASLRNGKLEKFTSTLHAALLT
jgi:hypothetical protein